MASSFSTPPSASLSSVVKTTATLPFLSLSKVSFRCFSRPNLLFFSKSLQTGQNDSAVVKAQLNEVAVDGSSNDSTIPPVNSGSSTPEPQDAKPSSNVFPPALATEESISEFLNQVSSLVKLVDSRDIVELQLKQLDCELIIRKNVALPQPPSAAPVVMSQASSLPPVGPPTQTAPASAPTPSGQAPAVATPPSFPAPKSAKSLLPPLKCPMAGTFYTSPGPGEPPFVKVGDKVQKGQVLCIIEAMKLMNEIEMKNHCFNRLINQEP
uniref:Biotin carboxyl carrier protein of acetyl-CoA carboxylase n=1 Tax=Gossypium raimondii TaxID=29730 RepID=A0A0D2VEQ8_GOSRA|nr:hypothetical protein B456_013G132300 [Gossypium raimondii]